MAIFDKNLLDKAKDAGTALKDKSLEMVSDEKLADLIMKAVERQEGVNKELQSRGANYRIDGIELEMGLPPKVIFGVRRISEANE